MNKQHKHAEVLHAIADGKEVQFKNKILGAWVETNHVNLNPITHPDLEWRVKPEPKPDVVGYVCVNNNTESNCVAFSIAYKCSQDLSRFNLQLTWDGETGKLKKAEVIG